MTASNRAVASSGNRRKYHCVEPGCNKSFTTSGHLARHNRIHTGEKNFECLHPGCPSRFSRQDNMMQHYRTHLSPRSRRTQSQSNHRQYQQLQPAQQVMPPAHQHRQRRAFTMPSSFQQGVVLPQLFTSAVAAEPPIKLQPLEPSTAAPCPSPVAASPTASFLSPVASRNSTPPLSPDTTPSISPILPPLQMNLHKQHQHQHRTSAFTDFSHAIYGY
ncbi:hypothetical protein BCR43DRAFT_444229 [Syncephalastrum racemosum]|uniref:C2H2-type domain-containing protein n=1 Tax=Syncephalastrum racemosum TaxID=13706 RepID=A0A1X2H4E6_SYNRA|nr:hypothetical protein BCR43DRAFT_444229 [Syncephalastrum racemosum]